MQQLDLKTSTTENVVSYLTRGFETFSANYPQSIDLRDLSENGKELTRQEMYRMLQNLRNFVNYSALRGHINTCYANVSYGDLRYFSYEPLDNTIVSNDLTLRLKEFDSFKFFVSESNWIDLYFYKVYDIRTEHVTMVFVP